MKRRAFVLGVAALCVARPQFAQADWANGQIVGDQFEWTNGGGDPYRGTFENALTLAGITDPRVRGLMIAAVSGPGETYEIKDGDQFAVMISGNPGWVAQNVVAYPSRWRSGRSRMLRVWYVTDPVNRDQYRIVHPGVCGNWCFDHFGAALPCRCELRLGDACPAV